MQKAYRVLAGLIAVLVIVQAAALVFADSGFTKWIAEGNTYDQAVRDSGDVVFPELPAFIVHGMNGTILIPLVAVTLFVVSFLAKVDNGILTAGLLLAMVVLQVVLGYSSSSWPFLGALHGINALLIFAGALQAMRLAKPVPAPATA